MESFTRADAQVFVRELLQDAASFGVRINPCTVDHICYRTDTLENYEEVVRRLSLNLVQDFSGRMLSVAQVNGRPIATWKLDHPIEVDDQWIECIEVPSPKPGRAYALGWEHIEAITFRDLRQMCSEFKLLGLHADLSAKPLNSELAVNLRAGTIKWHILPLSCVIAIEENLIFKEVSKVADPMRALERFDPLPSGGSLLGVSRVGADLDMLLHSADIAAGITEVTRICHEELGLEASVECGNDSHHANIRVATDFGGFEMYLENIPTWTQRSHRHLINEWRLLVRYGERFCHQVKALKQEGFNTEQAFCRAANYPETDPFTTLLNLPYPTV